MYNLSTLDLCAFIGMFVISVCIGIYFAYFSSDGKHNTVSVYLVGGKTMGVFPVSMSLIASYVSGIFFVGLPAEMYVYGTQISLTFVSQMLASFTMAYAYIPVYHKLRIISSYDYLNKRFGPSVKILGAGLFILQQVLYIGLVIYAPALAFSQITGMNLHQIIAGVSVVCIFYTSLGGMKAVVWTDTLQTILMMAALIIVLAVGLSKVGGFSVVYEKASTSNRLEFLNTDYDPRTRMTIWTVLIGDYFSCLAWSSANQAMVQRFLSLPSLRKINIAIIILTVGYASIICFSCLTGLVIYAMYYNCDPVLSKRIEKHDQLLPFFVKENTEMIPGLLGIFLSGLFSASLSSMSTGLNSMAGILYEDIIKPIRGSAMSDRSAGRVLKLSTVFFGILCTALALTADRLGTLVEAVAGFGGIAYGALLGLFTLGVFFPWVNGKGALIAGVTSVTTVSWLFINAQKEFRLGNVIYPKKSTSVEGCPEFFNNTLTDATEQKVSTASFFLFGISYFWYILIGTIITLIVGIVFSCLFGFNDAEDVDPDLLSPLIQKCLPSRKKGKNRDSNGTDQYERVQYIRETVL